VPQAKACGIAGLARSSDLIARYPTRTGACTIDTPVAWAAIASP
jgi:hypothetical protein